MTQVTLGRVFVWQLAAVLTVGLLAQAVVSRPTAWVVITLASAACLAPSFLGHGGLTGGHAAATISLAVHLVSVSVWLGGLAAVVALLLVDPRLSQSTLPRFSAVALGAAVVAAESGLLNASIRLTAPALFLTTWYGALVIGKVILIGWLAYFGLQQRRNVLPQLDAEGAVSSRGLARYAATEFILMGCAVGVAVAMSRIGPLAAPNSNGLPNLVSVSVLLLGLPALAPLLFNRAAPAILTRNPEVMGVIAAVITIELFGLNLLGRLLGAQLGALVSICAIMLIGWALAISLHGSDRRSGVYTTMLSWIVACGVTLYFQLREPQAVVDTRSVLAASLLGVGFLALHLVPPLADSSNTQALEWHESASD
jgi:putative copper export protein